MGKKGQICKRTKTTAPEKVVLDEDQKRKLAETVEKHPQIWNLSHPQHRRTDIHTGVWQKIAKEMDVSVDVCKTNWKSLRDGMRYRKAPKQVKRKSGDSAPEESDMDENNEPESELLTWPFYDCMQFYASQKRNRKTISSADIGDEANSSVNLASPETHSLGLLSMETPKHASMVPPTVKGRQPQSNYNYQIKRKRPKSDDGADKLASGIADLIQIRKEASQSTQKDTLMYHSMFANLDRMFKQLPFQFVEDLNMQFVSLTYDAIKRQQNIIVISADDDDE